MFTELVHRVACINPKAFALPIDIKTFYRDGKLNSPYVRTRLIISQLRWEYMEISLIPTNID